MNSHRLIHQTFFAQEKEIDSILIICIMTINH